MPSNHPLRGLPLPSVLSALSNGVSTALDTVRHTLQTVSDGFGAGCIVDGLANAAAGRAYDATDSLGESASEIANLRGTLDLWLSRSLVERR